MKKSLLTIGLATLLTVGIVSGGALLAPNGSNQTSYFNYSYISTNNSTTSIKTGSGVLHTITVGTPTTSSIVTVFDGTVASNTIIAKLLVSGPDNAFTLSLDVYFANGLTVQQTGATSTVTVSYY